VNFDEVFHAAAAGTADFGVVPVENSTEGVVTRSLDLLLQSPLHIVGEISLLVRHHLLRLSIRWTGHRGGAGAPPGPGAVPGLARKHLPNAERRAVSSNAEGARLAATNPAWAGIAGERAGASSACTSWPTPFRTTPSTAPALPWSACRKPGGTPGLGARTA
jgi:chorismate mutase/prephenate dehydratase